MRDYVTSIVRPTAEVKRILQEEVRIAHFEGHPYRESGFT